jgi:predicted O-methyltransferase YrrM
MFLGYFTIQSTRELKRRAIKRKKMLNIPKALPADSDEKDKWANLGLQPNETLQSMFATYSVIDKDGNAVKFSSGVSPIEGWYLYQLVLRNPDVNTIVEVGMAYGTSALYICQALSERSSEGRLISVDPNQSTQWQSIGVLNVERANLKKYHALMEMGSELALPSLMMKHTEADMVFIDGMHLFDYTLLDIFYACKLLRVNGLLVIDDIRHASVKKAVKYIRTNYKFMQFVSLNVSSATMATFVKVGEDQRNWNFHSDF